MNAASRPRIDAEAVKAAVLARGGLQWLAEGLGLEVKGRTLRCPNAEAHAHGDKHPSASIGPETWKCHACGAGGDALELVRVVRGLTFPADFPEVLAELADIVGVAPESQSGRVGRPAQRPAPRQAETPMAPTVPDGAAGLLAAVWALVEPLLLTDEAMAYLKGRAIEPWTVRETGARDWWPRRHELRELLNGATDEALTAAGFYSAEAKPWWPVAALVDGDTRGRGLFVPIFLPGNPAPMGWRWRTIDREARIKALSMPGARPAILGLGLPAQAEWLRPAAGQRIVVVAEGEPDWWTLLGAMADSVGIVTLTAKSAGWPDWATPYLDRAEAVVVLTHEPKRKADCDPVPADTVVDSLFVALSRRRGRDAAKRVLRVLRQDETTDWNDLAKAGRLAERLELLAPLIGETMPRELEVP